MWTPTKSVHLSCWVTKFCILAVFVIDLTAPYLFSHYLIYAGRMPELLTRLLLLIYACSAPALVALFVLHRLLTNIRRGQVFIPGNVKCLRTLSWCCFAAAAILLVFGFQYVLFLLMTFAAVFFGLILRVVKNVIEEAVLLKQENDYTI